VSPPEAEEPGTTPDTGPVQKSGITKPTNQPQTTTPPRQCAADTVAGLHQRRKASYRLVPLDRGCRDPWVCRCTEPALSEDALASWRDAAEHLLATVGMPVMPLEVRRALYRRGGRDRALAERLHRGCGGRVA
jgi:hypothetical protein